MNIRMSLIAAAFMILAGCTTTTTDLLSVALDKQSPGQFEKIMVMAISDNEQVRTIVEQSLAGKIASTGTVALAASDYVPGHLASMDKETLHRHAEEAIRENGADAVLVTTLIDNSVRDQYTPPQVNQVAMPVVEPRFGNYVGMQYETVMMPGYFTSLQEVYIQTTLFDTATGHAVWKAQSKTINPVSLEDGVKNFSNVMVPRLESDGMLGGGN
ncbi:hypothetical protein [Marinobacter zhejiangensis]|uniref:DUF4136 domain-containing protein n=1 Tax=Marinobacter zhejiangensis TaxID=488535 RepID=A0A1I4NCD7_9GAMM|nr:hypothetical protein [Marinobacter zhejiangensis]SFM13161.1 hypothetical protein SAMN04487963_1291 [Marinobacter zhejiangensis]